MIKRILSSKTKLGIAIIVILMLVMGLSYGTFLVTTDNYKVSELLIAELNYGITITKDDASTCTINETKVTTPASSECFITIEISSVNPIDSRYALAYKNEQGSADVKYTDKTQWKSEGVIEDYNRNYTRKVRVVINNTGQNEQAIIDFKVFGGYKFNTSVAINLQNGYKTIPGTYTESIEARNNRLVDIIEKDTNCTTSTSKECLYGGGTITNYLQYPTNEDKTQNLWRITGSYELDGTTYAKVVYNSNKVTTASANITNALDSFYKTLDKPDEVIQNTNKFNCTKDSCTQSDYSKIGLLSVYEYEQAGGYESYLGNEANWFALQDNIVKNITSSGIQDVSGESGIRPTAYLQTDVTVTGKGTLEDPYRISPKGDINLVAYTYNGKPTTDTFKSLMESTDKVINSINCKNGTIATWKKATKSINLTDVHVPDYCIVDFTDYNGPSFIAKLKEDNKTRISRETSSFNSAFTQSGLYVENDEKFLETDGKDPSINEVLYFAGNGKEINNWVVFGGFWWRIIRTNEDGSVRLLYAGKATKGTDGKYTGHDAQDGIAEVGNSKLTSVQYNSSHNNTMYVGYMYGNNGNLASNRLNTNASTIKGKVDAWYDEHMIKNDDQQHPYGSYLSRTAIYCNDRATQTYASSGEMNYAVKIRLNANKRPSFKCGNDQNGSPYTSGAPDTADRFTGSNESDVGNEKLGNKPVGLMTADEVAYAGGVYDSNSDKTYYYLNSSGSSVTGSTWWWTMSPFDFYGGWARVFCVGGSGSYPGYLGSYSVPSSIGVRPVVSLKSCVSVSGKGTTSEPYIPTISAACALADN